MGACIVHARRHLVAFKAGGGREDAPPPGEVPDIAGRNQTAGVGAEAEVILCCPVVVKDSPVAFEVPRLDALGILINEAEQVGIHRAWSHGSASAQMGHGTLIVPLCISYVGIPIAISRPSDLSDDDRHVPESILLQRPDQGVIVGIKHIGVGSPIVIYGARVSVEECVVHREVGIVVEAYERVDVDSEWSSILAQESNNLHHQIFDVCSEIPRRRLLRGRLVDIGVERNGDLHPVAEAGFDQSRLNILKRRISCG